MEVNQRNELIGSRIRKVRKEKHLTQEKLGEMTNTSLTTISRLELGKQMVSVNMLFEIAEALEVGIEVILQDLMIKKPDEKTDQELYYMLEKMGKEEKEYTKKNMKSFLEYKKQIEREYDKVSEDKKVNLDI